MTQRSPAAVASRGSAAGIPETLSRRVVIERIEPSVDGGRFPVKRTIGETVEVTADVFADGHDVVVARLRERIPLLESPPPRIPSSPESRTPRIPNPGLREPQAALSLSKGESRIPSPWREHTMTLISPGSDRWIGRFDVGEIGWHEYQIVAWVDRFLSWRRDLEVKARAGQDVGIDLLEGAMIVREAAARAEHAGTGRADANWLLEQADALSDSTLAADRIATALGDDLRMLMAVYTDRSRATTSEPRRVWVDRERARFGAWYEMFPRSAGPDPSRSGTFREAAAELPRIADLGFDVVYLPPIHPIGTSFRKGCNNSLTVGPDDPGSPWAIGSKAGGHTAIEPGLGTLDDFELFRCAAERLGLEVALDLAWQCSPDHPWVAEHPEWFRHRPDGTIKYAENPPKKYQDIYPFDFECDEWQALWQALLEVTLFWVDCGVRIFRVDNPHTKTFGFWAWMIDQVHGRSPDVLFLAEAFTRPKLMRHLAKAGFTQSYTYFTWRNTKAELVEYFIELTDPASLDVLRPNLFANTPDILHEYLQHGGRPAFEARLLLAATLGASYGIYSGFELCEGRAAAPGSEEYAESEKYQYRKWDWTRAGNINELVSRVNVIRRAHRALQTDRTLRFCATDNPEIIAYTKTSADGGDRVLTIVNLDPHHMQHGHVRVDAPPEGDHGYTVHDLLDDTTYNWRGEWNYVRLDPGIRQGHILAISAATAAGAVCVESPGE
jgi:starch synthase (maltosyl-transferring)